MSGYDKTRGEKRHRPESAEDDRPATSASGDSHHFRPTVLPETEFIHPNPNLELIRGMDVFGAGRGFPALSGTELSQPTHAYNTDSYEISITSPSKRRKTTNSASYKDPEGSPSMRDSTKNSEIIPSNTHNTFRSSDSQHQSSTILEPNEQKDLQKHVEDNTRILKATLQEDSSERIIALIDSTIPIIKKLIDNALINIEYYKQHINREIQKERSQDQIILPLEEQIKKLKKNKKALELDLLANWAGINTDRNKEFNDSISKIESLIKPEEEKMLIIKNKKKTKEKQLDKTQTEEAYLSRLLTSMQTIYQQHEESQTYHDVRDFNTFLQNQGERLLSVSGRGMNCMIRALLRSAGDPPNDQIEQITTDTRRWADDQGITRPGDLIGINDPEGQAIIEHLQARGDLKPERGITTYIINQGEVSSQVVYEGTNPNLNNYFVCLDMSGAHFYGVGEDNQTQHDSTILPERPITPEVEQPETSRKPWRESSIEDLIDTIHTWKNNNPSARPPKEAQGRLKSHRLTTDEWKQVRDIFKEKGIKSTSKTYRYLIEYSKKKNTKRAKAAELAKKRGLLDKDGNPDVAALKRAQAAERAKKRGYLDKDGNPDVTALKRVKDAERAKKRGYLDKDGNPDVTALGRAEAAELAIKRGYLDKDGNPDVAALGRAQAAELAKKRGLLDKDGNPDVTALKRVKAAELAKKRGLLDKDGNPDVTALKRVKDAERAKKRGYLDKDGNPDVTALRRAQAAELAKKRGYLDKDGNPDVTALRRAKYAERIAMESDATILDLDGVEIFDEEYFLTDNVKYTSSDED